MTWTGSILWSLLALAALAGAAEGQPPTSPGSPLPAGQELISLDVKDVDVVDLILGLAAQRGKNIVIGDDVKGAMSITFWNVPWEMALETVLESRGLQKVEKDNVIRIVSTDQLVRQQEVVARFQEVKAKVEALAAAERARQEALARGPLREETIRLFYADPAGVAKTFQGILGTPERFQYRPRGGIAPGPWESYESRYCAAAHAYYPQISQCPGGWQTVVPDP